MLVLLSQENVTIILQNT